MLFDGQKAHLQSFQALIKMLFRKSDCKDMTFYKNKKFLLIFFTTLIKSSATWAVSVFDCARGLVGKYL